MTALPLILQKAPKVKVIMASSLTATGAEVTIRALSLGAADYVTKPSARHAQGLEPVARDLVRKIRALAGGPPPLPEASAAVSREPVEGPKYRVSPLPPKVLGIASSTGGPNALVSVLAKLPSDFPLPILIAQHMPPLFTTLLAERLGRESGLEAAEGKDGEPVRPGRIYLAPGDYHMTVEATPEGPVVRLNQDPPENFCRPAADPLFRSMAEVYGGTQLTLVLTGMGHDGLKGAEEIAKAGGRVIAQDQATSVVWGMPGAVTRAGVAHQVLPLDEIAPAVASHVGVLR
jgi:two-component system chemotaxis response regulator CheB